MAHLPEPNGFLIDTLGMEFLDAPKGEILSRLKVDRKVCQFLGILSGATSVAMAEISAGRGSRAMLDDPDSEFPYGVQISANHLRMVREGDTITAHGKCLSAGRTVHVWNIDIVDGNGALVSTARVVNIIKRKIPYGNA